MINCLSKFIKDPDVEKLELELSKTNIFEVLNIINAEIRHSNFLAWLLNPKGSHNLKDLFLKWFLKDVFSDTRVEWANEFMVDSVNTEHVDVYREFRNIDLLLKFDNFIVVIENKIWSKESTYVIMVVQLVLLQDCKF